jgi:hypothetical protein
MDCRDVDQMMDAWLDRELEPASAAEVDAHLAACDRCRRNWGGLVTLLTDPLPIDVPAGLRDRIVARVMEEHTGHPARGRIAGKAKAGRMPAPQERLLAWRRYAGAIAACMAFFVTGWLISGWWMKAPKQNGGLDRATPPQSVVVSPWLMSSWAQAAMMPGPLSPAVMLAQGAIPELMITPTSLDEPTTRVRPHMSRKAATQPAEPLSTPELRVMPMVPRFLGA